MIRNMGGFTVTSHALSHGHLAALAGKRFLVGGLSVYFSLFPFILLTHKIMIMFCIGVARVGCIGHCVDGSFSFLSSTKGKTKRTLVECGQL